MHIAYKLQILQLLIRYIKCYYIGTQLCVLVLSPNGNFFCPALWNISKSKNTDPSNHPNKSIAIKCISTVQSLMKRLLFKTMHRCILMLYCTLRIFGAFNRLRAAIWYQMLAANINRRISLIASVSECMLSSCLIRM